MYICGGGGTPQNNRLLPTCSPKNRSIHRTHPAEAQYPAAAALLALHSRSSPTGGGGGGGPGPPPPPPPIPRSTPAAAEEPSGEHPAPSPCGRWWVRAGAVRRANGRRSILGGWQRPAGGHPGAWRPAAAALHALPRTARPRSSFFSDSPQSSSLSSLIWIQQQLKAKVSNLRNVICGCVASLCFRN
jgi:hypothetical protein